MKQKRVLILLMLLAVISLLLNTASIFRSAKEKNAAESGYNGLVAEYSGGEVCEVVVDFGYVQPSATVQESIRLTNLSDTPIVLLDYSTQCRCMWLDFERKPIAPNESCDITITFDSRGEWGSVGNYMEITTSRDSAPIVLWIGAEIE